MSYQPIPPVGQTTKSASLPVTIASDDDVQGKLGIVTETAPASDTASSGLNGRLQRIAQRITSLIAQLPATLGIKTAANSMSVTLASDQATVPVSLATAPSTPVTGTFWQTTQPVSGTVSTGLTQPLTDTQIRATPLPVSGTVSTGLTQPLTDTQIRATALPVSLATAPTTPVTGTFWQTTQPVSGTVSTGLTQPLTDTQLRASAVATSVTDVSASASLTAVNNAATLTSLNGKTAGLVQLSGTWVGSVQLEGSNDSFVTTTTLSTTQSGGAAPSTAAITANGDYRVLGIVNYASVRARCSLYTSGTIAVNLKASDATGIQPVISTNAAGFLVTATLPAGSAVIGKVGIDQTTPGTTNLVSLAANQSVNKAQINGVTPLMGNGATGTGSQRVTVASDNTPFPIKIDQTTPGTTNLIAPTSSPLVVTVLSATNAAATLTLPAVVGQFHYITRIVAERFATTAITGTAVLAYTSTNLPGTWARSSANAALVGIQYKDIDETMFSPLKSSVANTNTTIVSPAAGVAGFIRLTAYYYTAA